MSNSSKSAFPALPRLDEDIALIEEFDRYRQTADRLRRNGIESLCGIVLGKPTEAEKSRWAEPGDEPQDLIHPALVQIAATREFVATTGANDHTDSVCKATRRKLRRAKITNFFRPKDRVGSTSDPNSPSMDSCVPVFQAARVLRASLASPITVFSRQAALAYYRIVRELASVEDGNSIIGGARATEGGVSSAFMTGECARAISALLRALSKSAHVVTVVEELYRDWLKLESLRTFPNVIAAQFPNAVYPANDYLPERWMKAESNRLAFYAYNEIAGAAAQAGIALKPDHYHILCDTDNDLAIPMFCRVFAIKFLTAAKRAALGIRCAVAQVHEYHQMELSNAGSDRLKTARLEFGHAVAIDCIVRALDHANRALDAANEFQAFVAIPIPLPSIALDFVKKFTSGLLEEVDRTRTLLSTTTVYLESILDREIERESSGQFSAGELVSAAASYAELERPELDRRLERATEILCNSIAIDGTFATSTAIDTNPHGYTAVVIGSELLRAFAQLLQRNRFEVGPETIKRMLSYFERTAVRAPNGTIVGWTADQPRYPIRASRWTSALAILALDRITRMLDDRINRSVFRHFSVKRAADFDGKPRPDQLFYSDYGIASQSSFDGHDERYTGSVAYLLERMRSHILGLTPPPGYEERCYSLLLFGPPGTGKTQLIESLATSAKTNFVEITPSDFLVEGEAYLERQARNVFSSSLPDQRLCSERCAAYLILRLSTLLIG